jgi:hypothetical protein
MATALPQTKKAAGQLRKTKGAAGAAGGAVNGVAHHASPYEIMAGRIANRVAEMAENITFVEREK